MRDIAAKGSSSELTSTWKFGCPPDPREVCFGVVGLFWRCMAALLLLFGGLPSGTEVVRFGWEASKPSCSPTRLLRPVLLTTLPCCTTEQGAALPPLLQFLAGQGWRQEHCITRGQMAARLGLEPALCGFKLDAEGDKARSVFFVAAVAAPDGGGGAGAMRH